MKKFELLPWQIKYLLPFPTTNVIRHFMEQLFASVSTLGFHFTSGNPISRNTRLVWFYCLFSFVLFTRRWIFFHISRKRLFPKSKGKSLLKRSPVSHFYLLFFYIFYILQTTWVRSRMTPPPPLLKKRKFLISCGIGCFNFALFMCLVLLLRH